MSGHEDEHMHTPVERPQVDADNTVSPVHSNHDIFSIAAESTPHHSASEQSKLGADIELTSSALSINPTASNLTVDPPSTGSSWKNSNDSHPNSATHLAPNVLIIDNDSVTPAPASSDDPVHPSLRTIQTPLPAPSRPVQTPQPSTADDDVDDERATLRYRHQSSARYESIPDQQFSNEDLLTAELSGPPSSMKSYTLRFTNANLESLFWGYNLPHYRSYAWISFLFAVLLFVVMLAQDVIFYLNTWRPAQHCDGLFSPLCSALGYRIVVSLFFVPAYALMLRLVVHYAETLHDHTHKHVCLGCNKRVPVDLCLSGVFAASIIVISRTIATSESALPVDHAAVCVFLFCLHLTAAFMNQSFAAAVLSIFTYVGYLVATLAFAASGDGFRYAQDYAASASVSLWSDNAVYDLYSRAYEVVWVLLWPLFINILSILGARAIEINRRKTFALVRAYMLVLQEQDGLERQRNQVWNQLCEVTDNRSSCIPEEDEGYGPGTLTDGAAGGAGAGPDFTSPAERALQLLQDIQRDGAVSNEVLIKARQVADILMRPGELYTPALDAPGSGAGGLGAGMGAGVGDVMGMVVTGDEEAADAEEARRWVSELTGGDKSVAPAIPEPATMRGTDPETGKPCIINPCTMRPYSSPPDTPRGIIPAPLEPLVAGMSRVDVSRLASQCSDWAADVEELTPVVGEDNLLVFTTMTALHELDLFRHFDMDPETVMLFLRDVHDGYHNDDNAYHNAMHAADVVKGVTAILRLSGLSQALSPAYLLAAVLAAAVIDVGHPGVDSGFHVRTGHELALVYNDRGVLENYHSAVLFRALQRHGVLEGVAEAQKARIRSVAIEVLLGTDPGAHFEVLGRHKTVLAAAAAMDLSLAPVDTVDEEGEPVAVYVSESEAGVAHRLKVSLLQLAVKAADEGHCARPLHLHNRWSARLYDEKFAQGDEERRLGLRVSAFMDRGATHIPRAQALHCDYVVRPLFVLVQNALELEGRWDAMSCVETNRQHWETMGKNEQQ